MKSLDKSIRGNIQEMARRGWKTTLCEEVGRIPIRNLNSSTLAGVERLKRIKDGTNRRAVIIVWVTTKIKHYSLAHSKIAVALLRDQFAAVIDLNTE